MGTEKSRRNKLNWFSGAFAVAKEEGMVLSKSKTIALFCNECASSKKTAIEILENFVLIDKIKIEGDEIKVIK